MHRSQKTHPTSVPHTCTHAHTAQYNPTHAHVRTLTSSQRYWPLHMKLDMKLDRMRTQSSSCTRATLWRPAHTTSCSTSVGTTGRCGICRPRTIRNASCAGVWVVPCTTVTSWMAGTYCHLVGSCHDTRINVPLSNVCLPSAATSLPPRRLSSLALFSVGGRAMQYS